MLPYAADAKGWPLKLNLFPDFKLMQVLSDTILQRSTYLEKLRTLNNKNIPNINFFIINHSSI